MSDRLGEVTKSVESTRENVNKICDICATELGRAGSTIEGFQAANIGMMGAALSGIMDNLEMINITMAQMLDVMNEDIDDMDTNVIFTKISKDSLDDGK